MTPTPAALNALEALRTRFTAAELAVVIHTPYPRVLEEARRRRAAALVLSGWAETWESERETPVIRALHAFVVEQEPPIPLVPWDGGLEA